MNLSLPCWRLRLAVGSPTGRGVDMRDCLGVGGVGGGWGALTHLAGGAPRPFERASEVTVRQEQASSRLPEQCDQERVTRDGTMDAMTGWSRSKCGAGHLFDFQHACVQPQADMHPPYAVALTWGQVCRNLTLQQLHRAAEKDVMRGCVGVCGVC